ncbi:MAG: DUF1731 domain-containing protein [Candidatus Methylomirabilales bacterium]
MLGHFADALLTSRWVLSTRVQESGYTFWNSRPAGPLMAIGV